MVNLPWSIAVIRREPRRVADIKGVVGWLYVFGGRSGAPQAPAASVIDRLVFVPVVLLPLVFAGVFPHLFLALAILEPTLAIGAWILLSRRH